MNTTTFPRTAAGKYFLVSGISGGVEVFVGKAIDEPFEERLSIEGRSIHISPNGFLIVRPFSTIMSFHMRDPVHAIQHVADAQVHAEITQLLEHNASHVSRASLPFLYRWIESSIGAPGDAMPIHPGYSDVPHSTGPFQSFLSFGQPGPFHHQPFGPLVMGGMPMSMAMPGMAPMGGLNPFQGFYQGFLTTAETFRRALYQSPQVDSTQELDKVTELEGDLTIELGKLTNQIASKLSRMVAREEEMARFLAAFDGATSPMHAIAQNMAGWSYLMNRIHFAKNWARRQGKAGLVRELHAILKESLMSINQMILEHAAVLDTLITEAFARYGISFEIFGDVSSLTSFTGHDPGILPGREVKGGTPVGTSV